MTKNLIVLERGKDELLLADSFQLRPLYVRRGRERIKRILAAAANGCPAHRLKEVFRSDASLIGLLLNYGILAAGPSRSGGPRIPVPAPADFERKGRITLYLLLSESCNLQCIYCLNGPGTYRKDDRSRMSAKVAFGSVEMCLGKLVAGGTLEVAFFGGEPLLQWPLIKEIIAYCEDRIKPSHPDKRINYHLTSNLTLRPSDLTEWVMRHDIAVLCGIDGPPEIHDRCRIYPGGGASHAQSALTIRQLVQAGARITLRTTITSLNHGCLAEVAEHHTRLGAASSLFVPVRPVNSDQEFFPEQILPEPGRIIAAALELGRKAGPGKPNLFPFNDFSADIRPGVRHAVACGAPYGATYVVRTNGDVYPCIYLVGLRQYLLGNVSGVLDYRPLEKMMIALHVDNREDCRECAWRYACGGGCLVMNLARIGGADKRPRVVEYSRAITCDLSRAILAAGLWDLADKAGTGPARDVKKKDL